MKIAVIDNGIDIKDIKPEIVIKRNDSKTNGLYAGVRHGSRVVCTVEKYNNSYKEYYIYDVISGGNSGVKIIRALEELLTDKVDVILMSLIIHNKTYHQRVEALCRKLTKEGTIIVAAGANRESAYPFPACLDCIIGVGKAACLDGVMIWNNEEELQVLGDVTPEFVPANENKFWLFSGTSKAAAIVAAKVLKYIELGNIGLESVLNMLKLESSYTSANIIHKIEEQNFETPLYDQSVYQKIIDIVKELGYEVPSDGSNLFFEGIVEEIEELELLIYEICSRLSYNIDITNMKYFSFRSIYDLARYIGELNEKK